ncbi:uncharacterized protein LOC116256096 isoform X1 [Nymphaea colorata]|uniref:uncharacterized protein LOC116256096 isoform X1 n=1 Tax=Nymphaea colorata TaxID=210225 RepID=UPI00129E406E|nr:uncharacterized protein LOC116256096 isoform X1 [Nymphaea colorata]
MYRLLCLLMICLYGHLKYLYRLLHLLMIHLYRRLKDTYCFLRLLLIRFYLCLKDMYRLLRILMIRFYCRLKDMYRLLCLLMIHLYHRLKNMYCLLVDQHSPRGHGEGKTPIGTIVGATVGAITVIAVIGSIAAVWKHKKKPAKGDVEIPAVLCSSNIRLSASLLGSSPLCSRRTELLQQQVC